MKQVYLEEIGLEWKTEEEVQAAIEEIAMNNNLPPKLAQFVETETGLTLISVFAINDLEKFEGKVGIFLDQLETEKLDGKQLPWIVPMLYLKNLESSPQLNLPLIEFEEDGETLYKNLPYRSGLVQTLKPIQEVQEFLEQTFKQDENIEPGYWTDGDLETVLDQIFDFTLT